MSTLVRGSFFSDVNRKVIESSRINPDLCWKFITVWGKPQKKLFFISNIITVEYWVSRRRGVHTWIIVPPPHDELRIYFALPPDNNFQNTAPCSTTNTRLTCLMIYYKEMSPCYRMCTIFVKQRGGRCTSDCLVNSAKLDWTRDKCTRGLADRWFNQIIVNENS